MFRLAHVTDPHFRATSFAGISWRSLFGKRAVGGLNLILNRRRKHRMELLAALGEHLRERGFDHLAITGDLGNVSLEGEWLAARRWIEALGTEPARVTVIPGNHDAYVRDVVIRGDFERVFAPYQTAELRKPAAGMHYPFARLRDEVAIVAVNTCVPTGDLHAWGRIGDAQLERLEALLTEDEVRRRLRVVLLHHPPVVHRPPEQRNLRDRDALLAMLRRVGAELVLHGHDHSDLYALVEGPAGRPIPVVGGGSASYHGALTARSRYNEYDIEGRTITSVTFAHDPGTGTFREVRRDVLPTEAQRP